MRYTARSRRTATGWPGWRMWGGPREYGCVPPPAPAGRAAVAPGRIDAGVASGVARAAAARIRTDVDVPPHARRRRGDGVHVLGRAEQHPDDGDRRAVRRLDARHGRH